MAAFEARRGQDIAQGAGPLLKQVNEAKTPREVSAIVSGHLGVTSDRAHPAGSQVLAAAADRERAVAAAAARAEEEARSVTNFCKTLPPEAASGSGEPSARDICLAIADRFDAVNDTYRQRAQACRRGDYRNDPILAMQCLGLCGGTGGSCEVSIRLTRLQKIACEKAQGQPGYVCDYVVNYSVSNAVVEKAMRSVLGSGTVTQGRFVKTPNGWVQLNR